MAQFLMYWVFQAAMRESYAASGLRPQHENVFASERLLPVYQRCHIRYNGRRQTHESTARGVATSTRLKGYKGYT